MLDNNQKSLRYGLGMTESFYYSEISKIIYISLSEAKPTLSGVTRKIDYGWNLEHNSGKLITQNNIT